MGDHAVFYTVCGCPSVVFSKISPDSVCVSVSLCLAFLNSLNVKFLFHKQTHLCETGDHKDTY